MLARAGLLSAAATATPKINIVVLNLKFVTFDIRQGDAVEARVLNINNTPAIQTDKVMMLAELGIETRR
jgi:hypothetical protein